jgi:hypothetical protein
MEDSFIFMAKDLTDKKNLELALTLKQKKLEEAVKARTGQLEEALQCKSRFLANMSHGKY